LAGSSGWASSPVALAMPCALMLPCAARRFANGATLVLSWSRCRDTARDGAGEVLQHRALGLRVVGRRSVVHPELVENRESLEPPSAGVRAPCAERRAVVLAGPLSQRRSGESDVQDDFVVDPERAEPGCEFVRGRSVSVEAQLRPCVEQSLEPPFADWAVRPRTGKGAGVLGQ
jgi:hypothetical protein